MLDHFNSQASEQTQKISLRGKNDSLANCSQHM